MGSRAMLRIALAGVLLGVCVMAVGAEDHQVEMMEDAPMETDVTKLQAEVKYLRGEVDAIAAKTKADMRAQLNEQKESYYKKMKKTGSYKGQLALATARATTQVAEVTEEMGKYQAMVVAAVEATAAIESKMEKDKAKIAALEKNKRSPEDIAMISKLKDKIKSLQSNSDAIAAEKKKAKDAHNKAADLHKAAAGEHKKEGDSAAAKSADGEHKKSKDAANADNLKPESKELAEALSMADKAEHDYNDSDDIDHEGMVDLATEALLQFFGE